MAECFRHTEQARRDLMRMIAQADITAVFQPILDLRTGQVFAVEAFVRPPTWSCFRDTTEMFRVARSESLLWEVEEVAHDIALRVLDRLPPDCLLFLNCTFEVLCDPRFPAWLSARCHAAPQSRRNRIVVELTDLGQSDQRDRLIEQFGCLRDEGFQIGIDDVGTATCGLSRIMRLQPNTIKLDHELISEIDHDSFRQNMVRFFQSFASQSNIRLIAEGVEREEELRSLIDLDIELAQGYLLGRPSRLLAPVDTIWQERIPVMRERARQRQQLDPRLLCAKDLAQPVVNCPVSASREDLQALIAHVEDVPGLTIMNGRQVLAYVPIHAARKWLRETGDDEPRMLIEYSEPGWIVVPPELAISEALLLATHRGDHELSSPVLVVSDDVVGVISMRSLLQTAARLQPVTQPHTSAMTGLPGRVQVDQQISSAIETVSRASVAFIDVRRLSDFNDAKGFAMGDAMIRQVAGMIVSRFLPPASSFVGHVADDRFVVVSDHHNFHAELRELADEFDALRADFFSDEELHAGEFHIQVGGSSRRIPLNSLRVILFPDAFSEVTSCRELHHLVRRMVSEDHATHAGVQSNVLVYSLENPLVEPSVYRRSA